MVLVHLVRLELHQHLVFVRQIVAHLDFVDCHLGLLVHHLDLVDHLVVVRHLVVDLIAPKDLSPEALVAYPYQDHLIEHLVDRLVVVRLVVIVDHLVVAHLVVHLVVAHLAVVADFVGLAFPLFF